jgi:uncharacterized membrane protein
MNQTETTSKKRSIPGILYITWTCLFVIFVLVGIPIANMGHSGGEQIPMTLFAYAIETLFWGYFGTSILTSMIFYKWFKEYWLLNLLIFLVSGLLLLAGYLNK